MLATEANAYQVSTRLDWVVHSAVGLDPQQRRQAEQLLVDGMKDPNKTSRHRAVLGWAALELSEPGSPGQRTSVEAITQDWAVEENEKLPQA